MKIKKEINLSFKKRKGTEFPVIMISIDDPDYLWIILFYDETEGVLLHSNNPEDSIGEFLTTLIPFDDKSVWKKFEGEINIRN
jgi:hypothetical protein